MTSVLFDVPGPRTAARHRVAGIVAAAALAALAGLVIWKLYQEGQFEAEYWRAFTEPNILKAIGDGLLATLLAAALAIVASVGFGAVLASARLSNHAWLRMPAVAVVEFFRAVPLLMLILFMFLAFSSTIGTLASLVIGLTLYNGSVLAEVFRAGVNAVPRGQSEAAYAIGLRKGQVMGQILAPQAVTIMLPAIISQCVVVLKDTSLGYIIGYVELIRQGKGIAQFIDAALVTYLVIAAIFIAMNYSLSKLAQWLERRMARRGRQTLALEGEPAAL